MFSLRTAIGLKQAELADLLGISRLAVGKWEGGINYPKAEHLKGVIALGVKSHAFPAEREAEEIRALWKAAQQKVLLDEGWLSTLLSRPSSPQEQGHEFHNESTHIARQVTVGAGASPAPTRPCPVHPTSDKTRKQSQWLIPILSALVLLTIVELGRSACFPSKR